ncbi:MAG: hypothetical protein A2252_01985 [Elusimicrobia bacterium RIFOXYA2_FULL_39_19]|nr:MAG: hypothetical protein A2252_01985 [Elusimicrobia bacterium RIFOXYA2_FULL_39_19]
MKNNSKYLIIGNSVAAVACVESIRRTDAEGSITLVSDETYHTYSRPLISYLLGGKIGPERMFYRDNNFYTENNVNAILGKKAVKIDADKKTVVLNDGSELGYEKLMISTGGTPIVPDMPGVKSSGVFTFTTWDDTNNIKEYIEKNKVKKAVVIGGGLIGLKATEALLALDIKVTILELADRILAATFDKKASAIIGSELEKVGCAVITNNTVTKINAAKTGAKNIKEVVLKNKKKIPAEILIVAIGVRPNIEFLKSSGIKTNRGIVVDDKMQSSLKDVYAAGDCCEAKEFLSGLPQVIAIWPSAARQGRIAGNNMAGGTEKYTGNLAKNSVELCGVPTISVGLTDTTKEKALEVIEVYEPENLIYRKVVIRNNKIVGIVFVGNITRAGIYTGLIKDGVDISSFRSHILKEDFGLISLPKEYRKHLVSGAGIEV